MSNNPEDKIKNAEEVSNPSADDNTTKVDEEKTEVPTEPVNPEDNKTEVKATENNEVLHSAINTLKKIQEDQIKLNKQLLKTIEKQQIEINQIKDSQIKISKDKKCEIEGYYDTYFEKGSTIRINELANKEYETFKSQMKLLAL